VVKFVVPSISDIVEVKVLLLLASSTIELMIKLLSLQFDVLLTKSLAKVPLKVPGILMLLSLHVTAVV